MIMSIYYILFAALIGQQMEAKIFGKLKPAELDGTDQVETLSFKQKLDHFSNGSATYWDQKYLTNSYNWGGENNNPVFLMVSGEEAASYSWMLGGAWYVWAARYGAMMFQLEHRFYGDSHPTEDTSTKNLVYLTSEQALEDIAYFISEMNKKYNYAAETQWVLFGGSYSGNLAAWARLKYPKLVYASVASSAPLKAKVDFYEYNDSIQDYLNTVSPGCANGIRAAINSIQEMLKTNSGTDSVQEKFNVCSSSSFDLSNPYDRAQFFRGITGCIGQAVQMNGQGSDFNNIKYICSSYMTNQSIADPLDRLAQLNSDISTGCVDASYNKSVGYYQTTDWNSTSVTEADRQWTFQFCNEFGYFQTSSQPKSIFRDTQPVNVFEILCTDVFGSSFNITQMNKAVEETNKLYDGTDIKIERVVFVQGSVDPWHTLGMIENPTEQSPLVFIHGTAHCQDMLTPDSSDSEDMKNGRKIIQQYLDEWLNYNENTD